MAFAWPILFILAVIARDSFGVVPGVDAVWWLPIGVACGVAFLMVVMYRVATSRAARRGDMSGYAAAETIARHGITLTVLVTLIGVTIGGWLDAVRGGVGDLVLIDELVAALPIIVVYVARAWAEYPVQRVLHEASLVSALDVGRPVRAMPGRWAWVVSSLRPMAAMVIVPMLVVYGVLELAAFAARVPEMQPLNGWLDVAAIALLLALLPRVVVWVLGTRRVREIEAPLRDRMASLRGPIRRVRLWDTHGSQANAAILGATPWRRTLLVTDVLLESLTDDELEVVLAHEAGHVRFRHLPWLVAGAASIAGVGAIGGSLIGSLLVPWFAQADQIGLLVGGVAVGMLTLGPLSRRMEWQADAHAVRCVSLEAGESAAGEGSVERVCGVLRRVGRLNGVAPSRPSWRHGSMNRRAAEMRKLVGHAVDRFPIDRVQHRIRLWTVLAAVVCVGAMLLSG